jgi:prepilin-type N-terminal cleavage/methylation domain-containing protein
MTTIIPLRTPRLDRASPERRSSRGFTLVEVMIGATLSSFVLLAVLTTFLFMGRSGANLSNYSDMESQARKALEIFAEDVRQASVVNWTSEHSLTITVNAVQVVYTYNSGSGTFTRTSSGTTRTLISGIVASSFEFKAYNLAQVDGVTSMPLTTAAERVAANTSTKQIQISLRSTRTTQTVRSATNLVLSARFILRNKIVTA